jgi:hypothetical protein
MPPEKEDERPAGDPDPDLTPDPDAGKETGDPAPGDKPGEGEGEEKDDKGVPLKNRLAESERKREKTERDLADERTRREQAEFQAATLAKAIPAAPVKAEESLSDLMYSNPEEYGRRIADQASRAAVNMATWNANQREKLKEVLADFPELKDKESEFARDVAREYQSKLIYHGLDPAKQHDAVLLADAANKVEFERTRAAKRKKTDPEPLAPTAEGGRGTGGGGGRSTPKKGELTPERRRVAQALGMSDDDAKDAYTHYLPEDANV